MKTLSQIDYTSLNDMKGAWKRVMRDTFHMPIPLTIGLALLLGMLSTVLLPGMAVVGIGAWFYFINYTKERSRVWRRFAELNGWQVTLAAEANKAIVPPGIANQGHSQILGDIVHAEFDNHLCDIFTYQFTKGYGKSQQVYHYTIARVSLPSQFPHIILDSKKSWTIQERGTAKQHISLEGDFDKYFSLYCAENEQIEALSIITPDVMRVLIASNQSQDVEIISTSLYFMASGTKLTPETLPQLLDSVNKLADQIAHRSQTLRYDVGVPAQQTTAS